MPYHLSRSEDIWMSPEHLRACGTSSGAFATSYAVRTSGMNTGRFILPLTVLRRFDCFSRRLERRSWRNYAKIETGRRAWSEASLKKITGAFYNPLKARYDQLLDAPDDVAPNLNAYITGFSKERQRDDGAFRFRPAHHAHG